MASSNGVAGVFERLQSNDLSVFPYRCVVVRNRNAGCLRCAQACTSGAIRVTADEVEVDPELCVGCGTCATVCPTCALEARHPNDVDLVQTGLAALAANGGRAVVVCERMWEANAALIDPVRAVRVTCLGRVEESFLVGLVAAGAESVALVHGDCGACPRNAACETYALVCDTANLLLGAWESPVRVELRDKLPVDVRLSAEAADRRAADARASGGAFGYDASRRAFFGAAGRLGAEALVAGATAAPDADAAVGPGARGGLTRYLKVMKDGTLPHFLPDRRERLLDALAELGDPCDCDVETRLWGRVEIDPALCRTCWMCATFCPTGAIARYCDDDAHLGVEHAPSDCVQCRCCEDVCPTGALELLGEVSLREVAAGGAVRRFELPPVTDGRGGPHSMYGALKKIVKVEQFYER